MVRLSALVFYAALPLPILAPSVPLLALFVFCAGNVSDAQARIGREVKLTAATPAQAQGLHPGTDESSVLPVSASLQWCPSDPAAGKAEGAGEGPAPALRDVLLPH